ncbi:MAG: response regulator [Salinivirgaceae bacterium]|jgi:CheY-like chemotaxis protein|nr:response regulator [Salinivirgaceae bacterium]
MPHKILIVDDIVINRILLVELIKKLGYNYAQASNGREALNCIESDKIDLVLMDIEMPVMNGIETTQHIRENLKSNLPIIALTAHNPEDFFETFEQGGFDDLITKPYLLDKIGKTVDKVLKAKMT